jgi:predicted component of type VI protein secretion system
MAHSALVERIHPRRRQPFVCGRKSSCTLTLSDNDVSNEHCMLVEDQGGLHVVDLGSSGFLGSRAERSPGGAQAQRGGPGA